MIIQKITEQQTDVLRNGLENTIKKHDYGIAKNPTIIVLQKI